MSVGKKRECKSPLFFIFKKNIKFLILGIDNISAIVYFIIKIRRIKMQASFNEMNRCMICGSVISDTNYVGIGVECYKLYKCAKRNKLFHDERYEILRKSYNDIKASNYIKMLEYVDYKKMRNKFYKSFIPSVIEQYKNKGFITKKQEEIIENILDEKMTDAFRGIQEEIKRKQEKFFDEAKIEVEREEIEKLRTTLRKNQKDKR